MIINIVTFVGILLLVVTNVLMLLLVRNMNLNLSEKVSPLKEESLKTDPFLEDVMHYAFEKGIKPITMPGQDGKNTLFDQDQGGAFAVCELFTTTHKQGTKGYNELFKRLKDQIDHYYENKILIRETAKSQKEEKKEE